MPNIGPLELLILLILLAMIAGLVVGMVAIVRASSRKSSAPARGTWQPPAGSPHPADDRVQRLDRLAQLRDSGSVTEEEFEAEKARILAG